VYVYKAEGKRAQYKERAIYERGEWLRVRRDLVRGQVAVITGSGQSMGRTHALDIASRGGTVVVNDIVRDKADAVVVEITESGARPSPRMSRSPTPKGGKALVDLAA